MYEESVTYRYWWLGEMESPLGAPPVETIKTTSRVTKSTECIVCPVFDETYSFPLPKAKPCGPEKPVAKVATVPEFVPVLPPVMLRMMPLPLSAI